MNFSYKIFQNFICNEEIKSANAEFLSCFNDKHTKKPYKNIVELLPEEISKYNIYNQILEKLQKLIYSQTDYKVKLNKLWLVKTENKDINMTGLPYVPHFDKMRFLKGMIYLSDVDINCGPIHLSNKSVSGVDKIRRSLPNNHKEKKLNYFDLKQEDLPVPVEGDAGTLVLFDTNTPHHGGYVEEGCERQVLRFDFENDKWNDVFVKNKSSNKPNLFINRISRLVKFK